MWDFTLPLRSNPKHNETSYFLEQHCIIKQHTLFATDNIFIHQYIILTPLDIHVNIIREKKHQQNKQYTVLPTTYKLLHYNVMAVQNISHREQQNQMNSKRMRSFTLLYLSPLREYNGIARIPLLSSHTGKHVCPPKSSFSDMSYS